MQRTHELVHKILCVHMNGFACVYVYMDVYVHVCPSLCDRKYNWLPNNRCTYREIHFWLKFLGLVEGGLVVRNESTFFAYVQMKFVIKMMLLCMLIIYVHLILIMILKNNMRIFENVFITFITIRYDTKQSTQIYYYWIFYPFFWRHKLTRIQI